MERGRPCQRAHLERQFALSLRRPIDLAQFPADHEPDDLVLIGLLDLEHAPRLPVAEDGDAVAELEHLLQAVRDQDHRAPVVPELAGAGET